MVLLECVISVDEVSFIISTLPDIVLEVFMSYIDSAVNDCHNHIFVSDDSALPSRCNVDVAAFLETCHYISGILVMPLLLELRIVEYRSFVVDFYRRDIFYQFDALDVAKIVSCLC